MRTRCSSGSPTLSASDKQLAGAIAGRIKAAGDNGLQPDDIKKFVGGLPPDQQAKTTNFFAGPFKDFTHDLLAHASASGSSPPRCSAGSRSSPRSSLINVKKSDLPTDPMATAAAAG